MHTHTYIPDGEDNSIERHRAILVVRDVYTRLEGNRIYLYRQVIESSK